MSTVTSDLARLTDSLGTDERLVFDLDGTLYDTRDFERPALAAVCEWLRERSGELLQGAEQALWERRETDRHRPGLFDDLLRERGLPREWGAECLRRFHAYPGDELLHSPSLKPLLLTLRARGRALALVTNGRREVQQRKLQALGLSEVFDRAVYCDPARPRELKPSAWAWSELQDWRAGLRAFYVGDDPVDAAFAATGGAGYIPFCFRSEHYDH
ncbi:MAG: HAD family hydrolase [Pseudomonadota bacterium]